MQIVFIRDNLCEMSNPFCFEKTIFIFPRKQDLTFHAIQKIGWHFMQIASIGDNMYEMSNLLSGKNWFLFSLLEIMLRSSYNDGPFVVVCPSVYASVNIFKQLLLWSRWANFALLSPAFSKKSGGTLFLAFRGEWFRISRRYVVPLTPPTVFVRSFWNFTGAFRMAWR